MEQDLGYQLAYQRGVQAVIWGMPAVSIATLRDATFRDLGARYNDVVYMSDVTVPRHELLTASHQALYVMVMLNVKEDPVVLDVPAATEKVAFYGSAVDSWMVPIADVDKGGRYLFLPPGYQAPVPKGYLPVPSKTFNIYVAMRPIPSARGTLADAVACSKGLRAYPLSQAGRSPANRYIDAYPKTWRTLPAYDMSYFETLAQAVNDEPLQEKDAAMSACWRASASARVRPSCRRAGSPGPSSWRSRMAAGRWSTTSRHRGSRCLRTGPRATG